MLTSQQSLKGQQKTLEGMSYKHPSTCHTTGWYSTQKTHKFLTLHLHRLHACAHSVIQKPTSNMDSKLFLIKTFRTEV